MANPTIHEALRKGYANQCDKDTMQEDFQVNNSEWHKPARVNTYIIDCIQEYEINQYIDEELWDAFQESFHGWTRELFELGNKHIRTTLKNFLKDNGLFVGGPGLVSQQLINTLNTSKYEDWPAEEIEKKKGSNREFNSKQNPDFLARMRSHMYFPQGQYQGYTPKPASTSHPEPASVNHPKPAPVSQSIELPKPAPANQPPSTQLPAAAMQQSTTPAPPASISHPEPVPVNHPEPALVSHSEPASTSHPKPASVNHSKPTPASQSVQLPKPAPADQISSIQLPKPAPVNQLSSPQLPQEQQPFIAPNPATKQSTTPNTMATQLPDEAIPTMQRSATSDPMEQQQPLVTPDSMAAQPPHGTVPKLVSFSQTSLPPSLKDISQGVSFNETPSHPSSEEFFQGILSCKMVLHKTPRQFLAGSSYSNDHGNSTGYGNGYNNGYGNSHGYGYGNGYGNSYGHGYGDGYYDEYSYGHYSTRLGVG